MLFHKSRTTMFVENKVWILIVKFMELADLVKKTAYAVFIQNLKKMRKKYGLQLFFPSNSKTVKLHYVHLQICVQCSVDFQFKWWKGLRELDERNAGVVAAAAYYTCSKIEFFRNSNVLCWGAFLSYLLACRFIQSSTLCGPPSPLRCNSMHRKNDHTFVCPPLVRCNKQTNTIGAFVWSCTHCHLLLRK